MGMKIRNKKVDIEGMIFLSSFDFDVLPSWKLNIKNCIFLGSTGTIGWQRFKQKLCRIKLLWKHL